MDWASEGNTRRLIAPSAWRLATLRVRVKLLRLRLFFKEFDPNQPRVPAGQANGGQWTDSEGTFRIAQSSPPRGGGGSRSRVGGAWRDATPAQQTRLEVSRAAADAAIARVRERDANWKPTPGLQQTIEGQIRQNSAERLEAEARYNYLQGVGIFPGRFAVESILARSPSRSFTRYEREEIDRIGRTYGCHTCGSRDPKSLSGSFFRDHQPATVLRREDEPQRLFPHCVTCSASQGFHAQRIKSR